ncbi:hypothetical protein CIHG_06760 [Coccidioides immitis H538.4]|uniref:Uncharacterized protein n=1 Tax=Coccidioides immitis H538.4 TaxID=396776 RepID=A0A0J8RXP6_COCIT|nr:hypothetical protein CIHG_06760 [Coccidioides immitis H538.4]
MKLSILIASLASLSGALADRVDLWERPNFVGSMQLMRKSMPPDSSTTALIAIMLFLFSL